MFALILTLLSLFILLSTFTCWQGYKILKLEEYKIDIMEADRLENMINNNSRKLESFINNRLHGFDGIDVGDIKRIVIEDSQTIADIHRRLDGFIANDFAEVKNRVRKLDEDNA
tara:strand:- start:3771 stop:4112 length:342 start_codon:yes stop_codon:yes gene_type:complete